MSPIWCYHNCLSISIFRVQTTKLQVLFYFHWYFVFLSNTTVARARDVARAHSLPNDNKYKYRTLSYFDR